MAENQQSLPPARSDRDMWTRQSEAARAELLRTASIHQTPASAAQVTGRQGREFEETRLRTVTVFDVDPDEGLSVYGREGPGGFLRWIREQTQRCTANAYGGSGTAWVVEEVTDFAFTGDDDFGLGRIPSMRSIVQSCREWQRR